MKLSEVYKTSTKHVSYRSLLGHRVGTIYAKFSDLLEALGEPHNFGCGEDKVRYVWTFDTPRGRVEIRDYWWNIKGIEWSVAMEGSDMRAVQWLHRYLNQVLPAGKIGRGWKQSYDDHAHIYSMFSADEINQEEKNWEYGFIMS